MARTPRIFRKHKRLFVNYITFYIVIVLGTIYFYKKLNYGIDLDSVPERVENYISQYQQPPHNVEQDLGIEHGQSIKIDWHDYKQIANDKLRKGNGEYGEPTILKNLEKSALARMWIDYGFNIYVSDLISVNRSVIDTRDRQCWNLKYYAHLPKVSVIITFSDTLMSVLLRTIHSVINRSPKEILKEIILVDEASSSIILGNDLEDYVEENAISILKVIRTDTKGYVTCRNKGAQLATGDILVFLESEIEVVYNWLAPLLSPIIDDYSIITSPIVDIIDGSTFQHKPAKKFGRGIFDWNLDVKVIPLLPESIKNPEVNYESPVFTSTLFAVSRKYFEEIQGYDIGVNGYGGEILDMSFKVWLSGGKILNIPCSRVAKLSKMHGDGVITSENLKLVAEIWMDDYKQYVYKRNEERWNNVNAIPSQNQLELREKFFSFSYYFTNIMPDFEKYSPFVDPPSYAIGFIKNEKHDMCLDLLERNPGDEVGVCKCSDFNDSGQYWELTWNKKVQTFKQICLDVESANKEAPVLLKPCKADVIGQRWIYIQTSKLMINEANGRRCLLLDPERKKVFISNCKNTNENMHWIWSSVNLTAMEHIFDDIEIE